MPKTPARKNRRKPADEKRAFRDALATAARRLQASIQERAVAIEKLALLNAEIPQLERTVMTLRDQIEPPVPGLPPVLQNRLDGPPVQMQSATAARLAAAGFNLLPADLSGMGSKPAGVSQNEIPDADDDDLPEVDSILS